MPSQQCTASINLGSTTGLDLVSRQKWGERSGATARLHRVQKGGNV